MLALKIGWWVGLFVLGTSIWVLFDAKTIGVRKGLVKGFFDMGPWGWFFSCLIFWIIAFPIYVAKRGEFKRLNEGNFTQKKYQQPDPEFMYENPHFDPQSEEKKPTIGWVGWTGLVILGIMAVGAIIVTVDNSKKNTPPPPVAQYNNSPNLNPARNLKLAKGWGWTTDNRYITGTVINQSDNTYSTVIIKFNLYDKENNLVGNAIDSINNLGPHETWKFKALVPYDNAYSAEFVGIDGF